MYSADREGAIRVKREEACVSFSLARTSLISLPIFQLSQMQCKQFLRFCFDLHFNKKINDKKLTRRLDELMSVLQIINIYCGFLWSQTLLSGLASVLDRAVPS